MVNIHDIQYMSAEERLDYQNKMARRAAGNLAVFFAVKVGIALAIRKAVRRGA